MLVYLTFLLSVIYIVRPEDSTHCCSLFEVQVLNYGYHKCVNHSTGTPVIGVGFNLTADGAQKEIKAVGADYGKVLDGKECLNDTQIRTLFNVTMCPAINCAKNFVNNYHTIGIGPQLALIDMALSLGCDVLGDFVLVKSDVEYRDFKMAAQDMNITLWCTEWVGRKRCDRDINCMLKGH